MNDKVRVAVVGCGYWGPNMVRNFSELDRVEVAVVCDLRQNRLEAIQRRYPSVFTTIEFARVVEDPTIDAVVLTTPVATHYPLAKQAITCGKHVFVEKPLTASLTEAEDLVKLARLHGRVLMVDHTFLYTGAVQKLKELIARGELGDLYYFDSVRVNLGIFQPDVSVVWDLAAHDISIMTYLLDRNPVAVSATGATHFKWQTEDIAYITTMFDDSLLGHVHVSWLSPVKIRQMLIAGSKRMIVYNDNEPSEKVKVYDRGVNFTDTSDALYDLLVNYRIGDVHIPRLDTREALHVECEHFIDCILTGQRPLSDGESGLGVVRVLEAAQHSIHNQGKVVYL
ncbi:MAG TPA: Gfo/Idh/MocA family oxidoreductase [Candidatus Binatia bacterium]|nr:Gfo/Idh/MocA family oxidoreductase [Candidatus Binatia bacterium]